MWITKEVEAKVDRINELRQAGFNTPKMIFLPYKPSTESLVTALKWADKIHKKNPKQIFNIRTYKRQGDEETLQTKHYVDIKHSNLASTLLKATSLYHCMIDAETPDNGRWAGNVLIQTNEFGRPDRYIIEYCHKKKRAMVRDHNKSLNGNLATKENTLEPVLLAVIDKALTFPKKDVILEWTYFCKPTGKKEENLVWWEYRSA